MMSPTDAAAAADAGADAIGLILHAPGARRLIDTAAAKQIIAALPPYVMPVGVFVDASAQRVREIAAELSLTTVQLHGDETPTEAAACGVRVIKSVKVDADVEATLTVWRSAIDAGVCTNVIALLLETAVAGHAGGTGIANDFDRIARLRADGKFNGLPPIVLSGGLKPETVAAAIAAVRPYAVDVSSGIEAVFGQKSLEKMRHFAAEVSASCPSPSGRG